MSLGAWAWCLTLVLIPLAYVVAISFMQRGTYGGVVPLATLENYRRITEEAFRPVFFSALGRSLWLAGLSTLLCVVVAFPLALFLVFKAGRWRHALLFLMILPFWTNFLIRTYAWFVLLSDQGWLNQIAQFFGFDEGLHLLFTPTAIFLGMFYNYLPYMVMSLYVSVEKLDRSLLDAAADLGAGRWRRFFSIVLPVCAPGLLAGSIMVFIPALGEFVIPDILGGGTKLYVGNLLAQQFLTVRNWPFGAALTVVMMFFFIGGVVLVTRLKNHRHFKSAR